MWLFTGGHAAVFWCSRSVRVVDVLVRADGAGRNHRTRDVARHHADGCAATGTLGVTWLLSAGVVGHS